MLSSSDPKRDLRLKTGYTPVPNFFLLFWAPVLGPLCTSLFIQLLRLSCNLTRDIEITISSLKDYLQVKDNRTVWQHLNRLQSYKFISVSTNGHSRFLHRLRIKVVDTAYYLPRKLIDTLPEGLKKLYKKFIAMSDLSPHEFLHEQNLMGMNTISKGDLMGMNTIRNTDLMGMSTISDPDLMGIITNDLMVTIPTTPIINSINKSHTNNVSINNNGGNVCVFRFALEKSRKFSDANYPALLNLIKKHKISREEAALRVRYADDKYANLDVSNPTGLLTSFLPNPVPHEWKAKQKRREAARIRRELEKRRALRDSIAEQERFHRDLSRAKKIWGSLSQDDRQALISSLRSSALSKMVPSSAFDDPFNSVWLQSSLVDLILHRGSHAD